MSETITAIATPVGEGGVSLIRISGPQSADIAASLFFPADDSQPENWNPQRVYFGEIRDPVSGQCVDEVLFVFFKKPRSYTAEDVVEISTHGGVFVSSRILQLVLDQGARLAEPGEFTRRAFLNGRLDLSQAEAVLDLIAAASEKALRSAVSQLQGRLSRKINSLYDRLLSIQAQVEAAIDFPEEGLEFRNKHHISDTMKEILSETEYLINSYREGKIFREGVRVTLVGKPNVGKSSLLNSLLQEDRAIVTPHPGTTRDTLEERIRIRDIHMNIIDSAGLRENPEIIEEEGIARTRAALKRADLALVILDRSQPLDDNDRMLVNEVQDIQKLVVLNKCDLPEYVDPEMLKILLPNDNPIPISATTMQGIDELTAAIYRFVTKGKTVEDSVVVTRERHREHLVQSREAIHNAIESIDQGQSEELVAVDIQIAMDHFGAILGKTFEDDLLDQIFGTFCIGK